MFQERRLFSRSHRLIGFSATLIPLSIILILLGLRAGTPLPVSSAAALPAGFIDTQIVSGLSSPTAMAIAPDGRIFVCLQGGQLRVVKNGALLPTPFVSLSVNSLGERGLLGVAFDPDFAANQFVYVYYTPSAAPLHNRVSRFTASGDVMAAGSETVILDLGNLSNNAVFHNGGALHFGPDGKLYIAVGDDVESANAQTLGNQFGKLLRINPDGSIPADNPFYGTASGNNRAIWALGLRNPFTFAFQPGTGRMFINDVGQDAYEEIDDGIAGSNYGWPACEGACSPINPNFRDPIYAYPHTGGACAITGGAFYNPTTLRFPITYVGKYFFGEYCAGWIKFLDPSTNAVSDFVTGVSFLVDLDVSANGDLYYLQRGGGGQLRRIEYTVDQFPVIAQQPASLTVTTGQPAAFSVSAAGSPPLSYQWRRDDADISGAASATYTIASPALADNGARFRCVVSNAFGAATSNEAALTVTTNQPPAADITAPVAGTLYQGGQTISYSGTGTDPEAGNLPPSAFTWQVDFHHDDHTHPQVPPTSGAASGSFVIPATNETAANVFYRIHLTVVDSGGLTHSVYRDVPPRTATIQLATVPPGLQLTLDGQPVNSTVSVLGVTGIQRTLGVVSPQNVNGTDYHFSAWSDGGAATHAISTPSTDTTYTATFVTCSYAISPTAQTVSSAGGAGTVAVTAPSGCAWTSASNDSWITVTAGASGNGNGSVSYSVAASTGEQRSGTMTIGGQAFTITQGSGCAYSISPASQSVTSAGGTGTVSVTAGIGCPWTAVSNASWITVTAGASGSGSGSADYSVAANTGAQRTGTIAVAGQTFTITQSAGCVYSISPISQTAAPAGGTGMVSVTAGTGCVWTAVSNASWITVTAGASGSGGGSVSYSVAANTGAPRSGTITIAGQSFTITQISNCAYSISPTNRTIGTAARTQTVSVTATAGCAWTAVSNASWITVTGGSSGTGNGSVGYSVPANTGPQRIGTITIASLTFTLTQNSGCTYSISPNNKTIASASGTGTVSVTAGAGCPWTAVSNASWITVTAGSSGTGNGSVSYSAPGNTGPQRSGTITIAGKTFTLTQNSGCAYTLTPTSQSFTAVGGTGTISVAAGAGCAWTAKSNNTGWITITSGTSGNGNGVVGYSVAPRTASSSRSGTMTIGGKTFTVTQSGTN